MSNRRRRFCKSLPFDGRSRETVGPVCRFIGCLLRVSSSYAPSWQPAIPRDAPERQVQSHSMSEGAISPAELLNRAGRGETPAVLDGAIAWRVRRGRVPGAVNGAFTRPSELF